MKRRLVLLAMVTAACASGRSSSSGPIVSEPLASFATMRMIVVPVQSLRAADTLGWSARVGDAKRFLVTVDSALEKEFRERGMGSMWSFPPDLARSARRNPTYAADPATIRAGDAVRVMERRRDSNIPEPVAMQLRALAGFHDARHAMVPVELRFEPVSSGGGRAVLRVVVLDVRASRIAWSGDIASEIVPDFTPAIASGLARRFADLVVAR